MTTELYPPLSICEIGQRQNQEDTIGQWNNRLFVLCDGMGGYEKGEVASQTVCQSLVRWFAEHLSPEAVFTDNQLCDALAYAYAELDQCADDSSRQMGTTLTLLYLHRRGATAAHIGDSRIYHIRPGVGFLYQSRDHSLVFDLFRAGEITYQEMLSHPKKNIITRAMSPGADNRVRPDIVHITDIRAGDYFYLCSDGMMERMDHTSLFRTLAALTTDEEKRRQLITATADNQDNHSAWIIRVKEVSHDEKDSLLADEEATAPCNALRFMPWVNERIDDDDVTIVREGKKSRTLWQRLKALFGFSTNRNS